MPEVRGGMIIFVLIQFWIIPNVSWALVRCIAKDRRFLHCMA